MMSDTGFCRHTLATLAYRGAKVLRDAPVGFEAFQPHPTARTPIAILAHINDLLGWIVALSDGQTWRESVPQAWDAEVDRFFAELARAEARLSSEAPLAVSPEKLFQGPIADALTHVGQIAMLRRMAGAPVRGENYVKADIAVGQVGREQPAPRREFD